MFKIKINNFPYWIHRDIGLRCRYCGKSATYVSIHPKFQTGYDACYYCVSEGPCTPHYINDDTYNIGNMTYHVDSGAHNKGVLSTCGGCYPQSAIIQPMYQLFQGAELRSQLKKLDCFYNNRRVRSDALFPDAYEDMPRNYRILHETIRSYGTSYLNSSNTAFDSIHEDEPVYDVFEYKDNRELVGDLNDWLS